MKKILKVVLVFFAIGLGAGALSFGIGLILPETHSLTRTWTSKQPSEAIWETLTNFQKHTEFRPDLASVTKLENNGQNEVWVETYKNGESMTFETTEFEFGKKIVRAVNDPAMSGNWAFTLEPTDGGTTVTLTETATVKNPFFRFICRVLVRSKYMDQFLGELATKLGETAEIK